MKNNKNRFTWISLLFLILFLAVTYLPNLNHFGYYNDDWWQIYGGETFGIDRFSEMYSSDRPARAFLHAPLFALFGSAILPYQYLSLVLRLLGAIGLFWTLSLVWKNQKHEIFFMSLLFLVYPGFLQQPNAFDYISHQFALTLMIFSIGLSVKFIQTNSKIPRLIYFLFSSIFSLVTFFLMDYYLGMEAYRWLILLYLQYRENKDKTIKHLFTYFLKVLPFSIPVFIFLVWRIFLFQSSRYTTDLGRIGTGIFSSPALSIFNIFRRWFVDIGDIFISIWTEPAYQTLSDLRGYDLLYGLILGVIGVGLVFLFTKYSTSEYETGNHSSNWAIEAALIGFLGAIICLIPINIAEREVSFPTFNRFSFPSAVGVSITIVALIAYLVRNKWQNAIYALLIFSAILTHYTNQDYFAKRWIETQNLWQQWVWRVPSLQKGTVLSGLYSQTIQEGFFIWVPANMLYFPESKELLVGAEVLNENTINEIKMKNSLERDFRSFEYDFSLGQILVFSKPTTNTCLRFLDQDQIEISQHDHPLIPLAAPYSQIGKISEANTLNQEMFTQLFGNQESKLSWCYIYEKASLARQFGNWQEIIRLHDVARQDDLRPYDHLEWFPFLQAYAYTGKYGEVDQLVPIINETPFYRYQACQIFSNKAMVADSEINIGNQYLADAFCD